MYGFAACDANDDNFSLGVMGEESYLSLCTEAGSYG